MAANPDVLPEGVDLDALIATAEWSEQNAQSNAVDFPDDPEAQITAREETVVANALRAYKIMAQPSDEQAEKVSFAGADADDWTPAVSGRAILAAILDMAKPR